MDTTPSSQMYSPWKAVEAKFPKSNPSRRSLDASDIFDLLNEHFSEREIQSVIDGLQNLVEEVYNIIESRSFKENSLFYSSSDFRDDIKKFQTKYPQVLFVSDQLKMSMFILSLLKSKIPGVIKCFTKYFFPMYRSFGTIFCQTLCNPTFIEKARKILKGDSIVKGRNNVIAALKELFVEGMTGPPLLNIIHMISSCGDYKTSIIDPEMECKINLSWVPLVEEDGKALSIAVNHCTYLRTLSLQECELDSKFLCALYSGLLSSKVKIMELDVSFNTDIDFSILGKLFKKHQVLKLMMEHCCFNLKRMNNFAEQFGEGKIMELDVSWNIDMDFSVLGKLFKKHQVQKLTMQYCSLNFEKLHAFMEQSGDGKIMELDVSSNIDMDFSVLGKLFKKHQVQKLKISDCSLKLEKLNAFNEQSGEGKIMELDVSGNEDMDFSGLGRFFKKHQVQKLRMRRCSLNFKKLNAFAEQSGEGKIVEIDVSINKEMGVEGLSCLAYLMEKHLVERLIICMCELNYQKLNGIKEGSALSKIISVVSNYINISWNDLTKKDISDLEKNLHLISETNIEVEVSPGCYLRSIAGISTGRLSADRYAEEKKRESEKVSTAPSTRLVTHESSSQPISKNKDSQAEDISNQLMKGISGMMLRDDQSNFCPSVEQESSKHETSMEQEVEAADVSSGDEKTQLSGHQGKETAQTSASKDFANKEETEGSSNAFIQATGSAQVNVEMMNPVFNLNIHHNQLQYGINQALPIQGTSDLPLLHDQHSSPKDWTQLSPSVSMYNDKTLRPGTEVYRGIQEYGTGARLDLAVKLVKHTKTHINEVNTLVKLAKHDHVVRIVDSGKFKGAVHQIFIAMELCSQTLQEFINQNPFNLQKAESFFHQTLKAVIFIHSNGIIHRDLKPSNILISFGGTIKVSDFGISKEIADDRSVVTVTYPEAGTEGFKAPETYHGEKIGYKADIFSLAINGYFMLTHGHHPFGKDHRDWAYNIRKNHDFDLSLLPTFPIPGKRDELFDLLKRMLSHEPRDRPTAGQVLSDRFFKGQPKDANDPSGNVMGASALQS